MCHSDPNGIQWNNQLYYFYEGTLLTTKVKNTICDLVDCTNPDSLLMCADCPFNADNDEEEEEEY